MRSILDGITLGPAHQAKVHEPTIVEDSHHLEQEVHVATGCTLVQIHVTDWDEAHKEDPTLSAVLNWLKSQKNTDLKALLEEHASSEDGKLILWNQQNVMIHQGALYLYSMSKGETKDLLFVVPRAHHVTHLEWVPQRCGSSGI